MHILHPPSSPISSTNTQAHTHTTDNLIIRRSCWEHFQEAIYTCIYLSFIKYSIYALDLLEAHPGKCQGKHLGPLKKWYEARQTERWKESRGNKQSTRKCHNTDQNGKGIQAERRWRKKKRKGQFALNVFGTKSQPNVPENEWSNGESAERSVAVMATWMGEIINCRAQFAHCFPGIPAVTSRHCGSGPSQKCQEVKDKDLQPDRPDNILQYVQCVRVFLLWTN